MSDSDAAWMEEALALAERGRGGVEPNPLAGAVIVRDGRLVGQGWHARFGGPHAEVEAIERAGEDARGSTLYVTLEPCCHYGKTPPCTDAILKAGIRRVVAAIGDPNPLVGGKGLRQLTNAGITVELGCRAAEARQINAPYLKLLATGRPYVHAKWAMSLDGKIATRQFQSKWLTGDAARRDSHRLRARMDAIIVGAGTIRHDDPSLTARPAGVRTLFRIVLASEADVPLECQLIASARESPVIVVVGPQVDPTRREALQRAGCEVLIMPASQGRPQITSLLEELGRRRMTNILVEGGSQVLGAFFDAGQIDEVHVYIAPILMGGQQAPTPIAGSGVHSVDDALQLDSWSCRALDRDYVIEGRRRSAATGLPMTESQTGLPARHHEQDARSGDADATQKPN
jgi:diaminohydroxyphosphoribosylaminopyrimidine deaminase/5-amino-6-(5-phosphoribosylamino)uracil reductase